MPPRSFQEGTLRQQPSTSTPGHIPAHAAWRLQTQVRLPESGRRCRPGVLGAVRFSAASRSASLAAACAALCDAPSATAAHDALLAGRPAFAELQGRRHRVRQGDWPKALRRQRQPVAIDLTLIPQHGQPLHDGNESYPSHAPSGTSHCHAQATAYVIRPGRRFTVALTAVGRNDSLPAVLKRLLRAAARAGVRPRYLLLERGFCRGAVMRYRPAARHAWLRPLVLRGRKADHPTGPSGRRRFAPGKTSGWGQYTLTPAAGRTATFPVCVRCRNRRGERGRQGRAALVQAFGGARKPPSSQWVQETQRSRLASETSYRQMNPARIRTCTRKPLLRLLYVGVALVLRNGWVGLHGEVLAQRGRGPRRIDLGRMSFRRLRLWLQPDVELWRGIHEETHAQRPAWGYFTASG